MSIHSEVVVHTDGDFQIVRQKYWGFRCQSLSTQWLVLFRGKRVAQAMRRRDAKERIEFLKKTPALLPVGVDEAARMLAAVS